MVKLKIELEFDNKKQLESFKKKFEEKCGVVRGEERKIIVNNKVIVIFDEYCQEKGEKIK